MKAGRKAKAKGSQKKQQSDRCGVRQAKSKDSAARIRAKTSGAITGRKALRESEARYRALFEGAVEGILVAEVETRRFLRANPACCRMLGYSHEEICAMGIENIHPVESLEYQLGEFHALASGKKVQAVDVPCLRKDGTILYADISGSAIPVVTPILTAIIAESLSGATRSGVSPPERIPGLSRTMSPTIPGFTTE